MTLALIPLHGSPIRSKIRNCGLFRTATAFFFIANDGLSIIENVGELGVKLPAFLVRVLEKLKDTSEQTGKDDNDTKGDGE